MPLVRLAAHRWRWLRCSLHRALTAGLSLLSALLLVALAGWPLGGQSATSFSLHTRVVLAARKQGALRCARIRHEVSGGVVQYALRDGDPELRALVRPLFPAKENEKRLVVWSADHHIGPISDLRSIFEPLGVKFLEHTLYHACDVMCTCDQLRNTRVLDKDNIFRVDDRLVRRFWSAYADDADLQRADALLVSYSFPLLEIFQHYNESIIAIAPLRYDYPLQSQPAHWLALNEILHAVHMNPHNVLGANNLYDAEYIRYFTGLRVDYVPSFCGYTGEFYNPLRRSFLYSDRRLNLGPRLGPIWNSRFDATYTQLNASFKIENYRAKYHQFEYRDLATHLGIVYIPYQVSLMSFFEQYRMNIPLFAPSSEFLITLHRDYYVVYDRVATANPYSYMPSCNSSRIPPHPSLVNASIPDPNNEFSNESLQYWLPFSDYYHFPNVTYFESVEHLVETLHNVTDERLMEISNAMRVFNRESLKSILRYWRKRLFDIALVSHS